MANFDGGTTVPNGVDNPAHGASLNPVQNGTGETPTDYANLISPQPSQEITSDLNNFVYRR